MITRRRFHLRAAGAVASIAFGDACALAGRVVDGSDGRLAARPRPDATTTLESGAIGLGADRDGVVQMPGKAREGKLPLLLFLHGATQRGSGMLRRIGAAADEAGVVVVAPDSRDTTWDAIRGGFGEDVAFLNRVLDHVFARAAVDPQRIAIGGFSDGASYALSLAIANGDLFPRAVACSPGFVISLPANGRPQFFVSHGTADQILPIDQCSRIIVPRLRGMGYDVTFREFEGRHEMPPAVVTEAMTWLARRT